MEAIKLILLSPFSPGTGEALISLLKTEKSQMFSASSWTTILSRQKFVFNM